MVEEAPAIKRKFSLLDTSDPDDSSEEIDSLRYNYFPPEYSMNLYTSSDRERFETILKQQMLKTIKKFESKKN